MHPNLGIMLSLKWLLGALKQNEKRVISYLQTVQDAKIDKEDKIPSKSDDSALLKVVSLQYEQKYDQESDDFDWYKQSNRKRW